MQFVLRIFSFSIFLSLLSCTYQSKPVNSRQGSLIKSTRISDPRDENAKPLLAIDNKIWYLDSLVIEEVNKISITSVDNEPDVQKIVLEHYRFNDLRSRMVYEYLNFSDTARPTASFSLDNPPYKLTGGWDFTFDRKLRYERTPLPLKDTTIGSITYKRLRLNMDSAKNNYFMDCYFDCARKENMFTLDSSLKAKVGCPFVKSYAFSTDKSSPPFSTELIFSADSLTSKELQVFRAWEKNAVFQ